MQDTIYPHGWEAPWANWSYAWDAALTVDLHAVTALRADARIRRCSASLRRSARRTHVAADASIVWPPSLFSPGTLSTDDFARFADATIATAARMQRAWFELHARGSRGAHGARCSVMGAVLFPIPSGFAHAPHERSAVASRLRALRGSGRLSPRSVSPLRRMAFRTCPNTTLLLADDGSYGFLVAINPERASRRVAVDEASGLEARIVRRRAV